MISRREILVGTMGVWLLDRIDCSVGEAVPDAATRKKILVDNPARLYGF